MLKYLVTISILGCAALQPAQAGWHLKYPDTNGGALSTPIAIDYHGNITTSYLPTGGAASEYAYASLSNLTTANLCGANSTQPTAVGADGVETVGICNNTVTYESNSYYYNTKTGKAITIAMPGYADTYATGILTGTVIGYVETADDVASHGFIYDKKTNTYSIFDPPGSIGTTVAGISRTGTIYGSFTNQSDALQYGFLYVNALSGSGTFINLDAENFPNAINASGQVVGVHNLGIDFHTSAFFWQNGTLTTLMPHTSQSTSVNAITDDGQVAGYFTSDGKGKSVGFRWKPLQDTISYLYPPKGALWVNVTGINKEGRMTGSYQLNGVTSVFTAQCGGKGCN